MNLKETIKRSLRYILKGVPKVTVVANIQYSDPSACLKGKNIVVTGGGRGLGYSMAKKFAAEGANVLIAGRNEAVLQNSANEIGCKYLQLDVQDTESFPSFMSNAEKLLGGLDCLVNNAGISLHENGFLEVQSKQFDAQFATNLKGPFFLTQVFIEHCLKAGGKKMKKILFTLNPKLIL